MDAAGKRSNQAVLSGFQPLVELPRCLRADHGLEVTNGRTGDYKLRDVYFDCRYEDRFGFCKVIARGWIVSRSVV